MVFIIANLALKIFLFGTCFLLLSIILTFFDIRRFRIISDAMLFVSSIVTSIASFVFLISYFISKGV